MALDFLLDSILWKTNISWCHAPVSLANISWYFKNILWRKNNCIFENDHKIMYRSVLFGIFSSNLRLIDCTYDIFTLYSYCNISSIHFVQWYFQSISPDDHSQSKIAPTLSLNISWLEWVITNLPAMIKTWMYWLLVYVIPSIQHALKHRYDKFYI